MRRPSKPGRYGQLEAPLHAALTRLREPLVFAGYRGAVSSKAEFFGLSTPRRGEYASLQKRIWIFDGVEWVRLTRDQIIALSTKES